MAWEYYDIDDRVGIVNKWLGLLKEIFDILNGDHISWQMRRMKYIVVGLLISLVILMIFKVLH